MITTNLHPISHRFEVIADYWSNLRFRQRGTHISHTRSGWTPKLRTTKLSLKKLETLLYRTVFIYMYRQLSRFVTMHAFERQTDRQTDVDRKTVRMLRSRTVTTMNRTFFAFFSIQFTKWNWSRILQSCICVDDSTEWPRLVKERSM